jgi:hypothetical protein
MIGQNSTKSKANMPHGQCTKIKAEVTSACKRITLPISMEQYSEIVGDCCAHHEWIDEMIVRHPELFPNTIQDGDTLHDKRGSRWRISDCGGFA